MLTHIYSHQFTHALTTSLSIKSFQDKVEHIFVHIKEQLALNQIQSSTNLSFDTKKIQDYVDNLLSCLYTEDNKKLYDKLIKNNKVLDKYHTNMFINNSSDFQVINKKELIALNIQRYREAKTDTNKEKTGYSVIKTYNELAKLQGYKHYADKVLTENSLLTEDQVLKLFNKAQKYISFNIDKVECPNVSCYTLNVLTAISKLLTNLFNIEFVFNGPSDVLGIKYLDYLVGTVEFDLYKHPDKRKGGFCIPVKSKTTNDGLGHYHIMCNFEQENKVHLKELHILLHEIGHLVHHILSIKDSTLECGTNYLARDVVEIPSMFLQLFASDCRFLSTLGYKLTDEDCNLYIHYLDYNSSETIKSLLVNSEFDYKLFSEQGEYTYKDYKAISEKYLGTCLPQSKSPHLEKHHWIVANYQCGYYGYLNAYLKVLELFNKHTDETLEYNKLGDYQTTVTEKLKIIMSKGADNDAFKCLFYQG